MKIYYGNLCETGFKRQENQDSILAVCNGEMGLFVVADGMGGHSDGAYASKKIVAQFQAFWNEIRYSRYTFEQLTEQVLSVLNKINSELYDYSESNGFICGSTISVLFICGNEYAVINAGDSPVFMVNRHTAKHITTEHSYGEMVRKSGGNEKSIPRHRRNHLIKAVGIEPKIYPDVLSSRIDEKCVFMICSDGISRYYQDKKIFRLLKDVVNGKLMYSQVLEDIKKYVEKKGAADNFSIIIVECLKNNSETDSILLTQKTFKTVIWITVLTAIICAVVFATQLLK